MTDEELKITIIASAVELVKEGSLELEDTVDKCKELFDFVKSYVAKAPTAEVTSLPKGSFFDRKN